MKILASFLKAMFSATGNLVPSQPASLQDTFFPLPWGFDGWLYPCIQKDLEDQNVCLLDEHARLKLSIVEVLTLVTRRNREPLLNCAHRPHNGGLTRVKESQTAGEVLSGEGAMGILEMNLDWTMLKPRTFNGLQHRNPLKARDVSLDMRIP